MDVSMSTTTSHHTTGTACAVGGAGRVSTATAYKCIQRSVMYPNQQKQHGLEALDISLSVAVLRRRGKLRTCCPVASHGEGMLACSRVLALQRACLHLWRPSDRLWSHLSCAIEPVRQVVACTSSHHGMRSAALCRLQSSGPICIMDQKRKCWQALVTSLWYTHYIEQTTAAVTSHQACCYTLCQTAAWPSDVITHSVTVAYRQLSNK
jgi:hypothetical protein